MSNREQAWKILLKILVEAEELGAGTIHLKVGEQPIARVAGRLVRLRSFPPVLLQTMTVVGEVSEEKLILIGDRVITISRIPSLDGTALLVRPVRSLSVLKQLWPPILLERILQRLSFCTPPSGLILVVSPGHGGKSTLAAAIAESLLPDNGPLFLLGEQRVFDWSDRLFSRFELGCEYIKGMILFDEVNDEHSASSLADLVGRVPIIVATLRAGRGAGRRVFASLLRRSESELPQGALIYQELLPSSFGTATAAQLISSIRPAECGVMEEMFDLGIGSGLEQGYRAGHLAINEVMRAYVDLNLVPEYVKLER